MNEAVKELEVEPTDEAQAEEVETEESKTPESVPLATFVNNKNKWKQRVDDAVSDRDRERRENEALRQENQMLKMQGNSPTEIPSELDFDTKEEYQRAMDSYIATRTQKQLDDFAQTQKITQSQRDMATRIDSAMTDHYKRAEGYAADFDTVEDQARSVLGDEVCKQIMLKFNNSEQMLYSLGKNQSEAARLQDLVLTDPTQLVIDLANLSNKLGTAPLNPDPPAPDEPLEGGQGASASWDQKIEKAREAASKDGSKMQALLDMKASARREGWTG